MACTTVSLAVTPFLPLPRPPLRTIRGCSTTTVAGSESVTSCTLAVSVGFKISFNSNPRVSTGC